jgi:diguanylate cyclase (GGDEF)-like protein/PAS domain S-box-containing protein
MPDENRPRPPDRSPSDDEREPPRERALQDHIVDVVHELRAPATVAMGLVERLSHDQALLPDARRDVDRLAANLRMLETHVRSLLAGARMDGPGARPAPAAHDVAAWFRRTAEDFAPVAAEHGVRLLVESPLRLDIAVDPAHLTIVLSNLVVNAIRATPPHGLVRCTLAFDDVLRIAVGDSGHGIPPADRARMLERFGQDRHDDDRPDAGTSLGVGLEIVGRIARSYDGWVKIGDAPEGGALVTVGLALQADALPPAPILRTVDAGPVRLHDDRPLVLVVADDPARGELLAATLRHGAAREVVLTDTADGGATGLVLDAAVIAPGAATDPRRLVEGLRDDPVQHDLPVLALVPSTDVALRLELLRLGVDDVAEPDLAGEELRGRVDRQVARRRREQQRRAAATRFRAAFHDAAIGIGLASVDGAWEAVNPALCAIAGLDEPTMLHRRLDDLDHPDDHGGEAAPLRDLLAGHTRAFQIDKRWLTGAGEPIWVRLSVSAERDAVGAPSGLVVQVEDVTASRIREGRLEHLAGHDGLTGLLGRAAFEVELRRRIVLAREDGVPAAIVVLELDDLRGINERFGNHAGDHALHLVSRVLPDALRRADVVARVGGDEFAVLLDGVVPRDVEAIVRQLTGVVREHPLVVDGAIVPISARVGWAFVDGGSTADAVLAAAESTLRAAAPGALREKPAPGERRTRPRATGGPGT